MLDSTLEPGADADSLAVSCGLEGALPTEFRGSGTNNFDTSDRGKPSGSSSDGEFNREGLNATTGTCAKCSVGILICKKKNKNCTNPKVKHFSSATPLGN